MQDHHQQLIQSDSAVGPAASFNYFPAIDGEPPQESNQFSPQRLLTFLARHWWIPFLTLIVGLGIGSAIAWFQPPTYLSTAALWQTVRLRLPEGSMVAESDNNNFVGTQVDVLKSDIMRQKTLEKLREAKRVQIPRGDDGQELRVPLKINQSSKSAVFALEASGANPAYVQAYLDTLMDVYREYTKTTRDEVVGSTFKSVTDQVERAERALAGERERLSIFKSNNILPVLEEEGRIAGAYLARLKTQLSDLDLELGLLNAAIANAGADGTNNNGLDASNISMTQGAQPAARGGERETTFRELELLKLQRDRLSKNLRPKHPKIVKLDADLERASKVIEIYQKQTKQQLESSRATVQLKIANVLSSITNQEAYVTRASERITAADELRSKVQNAQTFYDRLVSLLENVKISRGIDQETLAVLQPASQPKRTYTREIGIVGIGAVVGLGVGIGIVMLIAWRDDRFESAVEVGDRLATNVMGQLPDVKSLEAKCREPLLLPEDDRHTYTESYRTLRSALLFMDTSELRPRSLLITSAVPNEGKSTVSANLARTLAKGGSRVVLIDGDLRRGVVHQLLKVEREPGLTDLLRDGATLNQVLKTDPAGEFSLITCGKPCSNAGDLFLSNKFGDLLTQLRGQFDYVLIDSSPVFATDDATTLAPKVDGTLFVVRNHYSGAKLVREALELLQRRQAKVLGVVFNRADASAGSYYYYNYSEYFQPSAAKTA